MPRKQSAAEKKITQWVEKKFSNPKAKVGKVEKEFMKKFGAQNLDAFYGALEELVDDNDDWRTQDIEDLFDISGSNRDYDDW